MSSTPQSVDGPQRTVPIPSVLTNSFRAILDAFGDQIIQLRAKGSVTTTNRTTVEELAEYGFTREQETNHRLTIDYTQLQSPNGTGVANPLDADAQQAIIEHVDANLAVDSHSVDPDLGVTSVTIRVTDERLQEVTPAQTPEFDLKFVADPAEEPLRDKTRRLNSDQGLYSELGFNIQNLNLHSVIETQTKFTQQSDGRYLSWRGPEDIRPRSPERLAIRINKHVLPDQYGTLKPYRVADDTILELVEDEVETLADRLNSGSTGGDN